MGIEFSGGAVFTTPKTSVSASEAEHKAEAAAEGHQATVQKLGNGGLRIQISELDTQQSLPVQEPWPRTWTSRSRTSTPSSSARAGVRRSPTRPGWAWGSS